MGKSAHEIVMESRKELVDKLIERMEQGYTLTESLWNGDAFSMHNPVSDTVYQGGNRLRLMFASMIHDYTDPRWMTFKQAKEQNFHVKQGAKGILLEKWIFTKEEAVLDENGRPKRDPDGKILKETVPLKNPVVNYFTVFNASQIEGIAEFKFPEHKNDEIEKIADNFIRSSKCPIYYEAQSRSYYSPSRDEIHLPLRDSFKNNTAHLSVLIHEMSHSTGHESRLNRDIKNHFGTPEYAREELHAELSSLFTQSDLGIPMEYTDEHFKDHSNYIKSWISVLKNDPSELFRACTVADGISKYLMDNYEKTIELSLAADQEKHPDEQTFSKAYTDQLKAEIRKNELFPNQKIMSSIQELNRLTDHQHTLQDIYKLHKDQSFLPSSEEGKLVNTISQEFRRQELTLSPGMEL